MNLEELAYETFKSRIQGEKVAFEDSEYTEMFNAIGKDKISRRILAREFKYDGGEGIILIYTRDIKETDVYSKYNQGRMESVNSEFNTYYQVTLSNGKWDYAIDVKNVHFDDFYQTLENHAIKECFYEDLGL